MTFNTAEIQSRKKEAKTIAILWFFIILFDQESGLGSNLECDNSSNFRRKQHRERARAAYAFPPAIPSLELRSFPFAFLIVMPPRAP